MRRRILRICRFRQHSINGPAQSSPTLQRTEFHAGNTRPFPERVRFTVPCNVASTEPGRQQSSDGPTSIQPPLEQARRHSPQAFPFRDREAATSIREKSVFSSRVVSLLRPRGPTHVARFVVAVVVNAIQRIAGRWFWADLAHNVGQKVSIRVFPPVAHFDTAPAVILVTDACRCVASRFHGMPCWSECGVYICALYPFHGSQFSIKEA
jgi:hypothetical protein